MTSILSKFVSYRKYLWNKRRTVKVKDINSQDDLISEI